MKKTIYCLLFLLLLTGCHQPTTQNQESNKDEISYKMTHNTVLLDDGKPLHLGDTIDDIHAFIKNCDILEIESSAVFYSNDDIEIFVGANEKVKKISLFTATYQLDNGITIGKEKEDVKNTYIDYLNESNGEYTYFEVDGVSITFTYKDNKIEEIELQELS